MGKRDCCRCGRRLSLRVPRAAPASARTSASRPVLLSARAPKGGHTCRTNELRDCWKENAKRFRYVDRDLTPDGLQQVQLEAGPAGQAQILVKGRGNNLQAPPLSVMNLPVRVQIVNGGGACWESRFATTFQNTATSFKAKSD